MVVRIPCGQSTPHVKRRGKLKNNFQASRLATDAAMQSMRGSSHESLKSGKSGKSRKSESKKSESAMGSQQGEEVPAEGAGSQEGTEVGEEAAEE